MKTMLKRSMAILLILMMVISVLPMSAMAATLSDTYLTKPIRMAFTNSTTTTSVSFYRASTTTSGTTTWTTSNAASSTSTYYPWSPDADDISPDNGYLDVDEIKNSLVNERILDQIIYYNTGSSYYSSGTLSPKDGYYWEVYSPYTKGVEIPSDKDYITLTIYIFNNAGNFVLSKTIYVQNPYSSEEYTLKYSVSKTTTDTKKVTTESNKTFSSASAATAEDLKVVLSTVTGNYDASSFKFSSYGFNTTEYYLTLSATEFELANTASDTVAKKILEEYKADAIFKATITVTPTDENHQLRLVSDPTSKTAKVIFYQPVIEPEGTALFEIGGIDIMTADENDETKAEFSSETTITGTYYVSDVTKFQAAYNIPIVNNTGTKTDEYIIKTAETEKLNGTAVLSGAYASGSQVLTFYPTVNGASQQKITLTVVNSSDATDKATVELTVKFNGTAIKTAWAIDDNTATYSAPINSGYSLNLGSFVEDFDKMHDRQKAQFTFTISDVVAATGVYAYTENGDEETFSDDVDRKVNDSFYLDDCVVNYVPVSLTTATPGFEITLKDGVTNNATKTVQVKYDVNEGAKPSLKTDPSTLSVKPNATSSTIKLANYINNFNASQNYTYKVTSVSGTYGTFVDENGSSVSTSTGGSISASTGFQYKGTTDSDNSYDTLKVAVYYNGGSLGTLTITAKCDPGVDCYTKSEFDSSYGDDNAFGVYLYNAKDRYYSFDRDDFVNGDADFTDDEYEGSNDYIKVTTLPIGGSLSGLDRNNELDVADLDELKYVRTGATDTGIDCFKFTLFNDGSRDGTYVMWIVGNESYLDAETGYTEAQFKASYGEKDAFGKYAGSSGVTFAASDFTNGSVKLSTDYSDAYIEIVDEPIIGTLKKSSTTVKEETRIAVADLAKLKYTWEDYDKENIDKFTFYLYKSSSSNSKAVSTKFTMWIVGNSALLSGDGEAWSGTSTTMPIYKVTDVEVSDNIASVTLDEAWVTEALDTVKTGSDVTIAVTPKSEAKGLSLTVDSSLFTLANASKIKYITLSEGTTGASISVSVSDILSAGGSGKDFTVTLNKLTISTANDIVANSLVASTATAARSVAFTAGSANITFDSVGAAILSVPYTNSSSYDDEMVVIYDYSGGNTPLVSSEFTGRYATADISKGGQYLVAVNSISFSDVSANWAWTRGYIPSLAARGTISGMGGQNAGKYMPDGKLTRAEFIKLLVVSLGLEDASATNPFSDMSDHWAKQVVAAAVKHSIINSGTTFSPDEAITRRDMALYAYRAAQAAGLTLSSSGSTTTFKDENEITGEYLTAVKAMQAAGIINGMGGQYEGYYLPMNNTDRAAAAKIIWFLNAELYGWNTSGKY